MSTKSSPPALLHAPALLHHSMAGLRSFLIPLHSSLFAHPPPSPFQFSPQLDSLGKRLSSTPPHHLLASSLLFVPSHPALQSWLFFSDYALLHKHPDIPLPRQGFSGPVIHSPASVHLFVLQTLSPPPARSEFLRLLHLHSSISCCICLLSSISCRRSKAVTATLVIRDCLPNEQSAPEIQFDCVARLSSPS